MVAEVLSAVHQGFPSGLGGGGGGGGGNSGSSSSSNSSGGSSSSKSSGSSSSNSSNGTQVTASQWSLVAPSSFDSWSRRGIACPGLTEAQQKVTGPPVPIPIYYLLHIYHPSPH